MTYGTTITYPRLKETGSQQVVDVVLVLDLKRTSVCDDGHHVSLLIVSLFLSIQDANHFVLRMIVKWKGTQFEIESHDTRSHVANGGRGMDIVTENVLQRKVFETLLVVSQFFGPWCAELFEYMTVCFNCRRTQVQEIRDLHQLRIRPFIRRRISVRSLDITHVYWQRNNCRIEHFSSRPDGLPVLIRGHAGIPGTRDVFLPVGNRESIPRSSSSLWSRRWPHRL